MATRDLTTEFKTALVESNVKFLIFVEMQTTTQIFRMWNGRGIKSWDSENWLGSGFLIRVSDVGETDNDRDVSLSITLEGCSQTMLAMALNESQQNASCSVYFGAEESGSIVVNPYLAFKGYFDTAIINHSPENTIVTFEYLSQFSIIDKASNQRFTTETQQRYYPGDRGFEYVSQIENWSGHWGQV